MTALLDTNTVQVFSREVDGLHHNADALRARCAAYMPAAECGTRMAALILHNSQRYGVIGVRSLDSQIGAKCNERGVRLHVSGSPGKHRPPVRRLRLFNTSTSPEAFNQQVDRFRCDLANGDALRIDGCRCVTSYTHGVGAAFHTYGSVRINDAGKVSKERFVHA